MRQIYLIRHGKPDFPGGESRCTGTSDPPLSPLGRMQACLLGRALKDRGLTVFSSPLKRAYDTARALCESPIVIDDLREMHAGDWDGLSFSEIRLRWPELYEARGRDSSIPIPNAESFEAGQRRFLSAVKDALSQSRGDIAIVAHATVISSLICHITGDESYRDFERRMDCCAWYKINIAAGGGMVCELPWQKAIEPLSAELCQELMAAVELPRHIGEHCRAVAAKAIDIAAELQQAGLSLKREDILHAALLHDIARLHEDHPSVAAGWLEALGYGAAAGIVRQHHGLEAETLDEAAVVYIADKLIQGSEPVTLRERFDRSLDKCKNDEARAAHERRRQQAMGIAAGINTLCRKELIR